MVLLKMMDKFRTIILLEGKVEGNETVHDDNAVQENEQVHGDEHVEIQEDNDSIEYHIRRVRIA